MWPILRAARVTVFDWVEITIFDVTRIIGVVTNQVFPKIGVARCRVRHAPRGLLNAARAAAVILQTVFLSAAIASKSRRHRSARSRLRADDPEARQWRRCRMGISFAFPRTPAAAHRCDRRATSVGDPADCG